ncbi:S1C family serine protease [Rubinisphaera italica]|uniref:Putative periplasmic serine endoprotease DegP-like n=1 Tax=Rubinisphaera italica TaxID=2527969 RepID=A0A5C5XIP6_9PLAN|nr:trypsin-like peptidase domain-containing protein [Rubinisphaera italica]TWT62644.1 putative periplasmic serine endoprotease DegP-like precursor [Rubinisphaera italica]
MKKICNGTVKAGCLLIVFSSLLVVEISSSLAQGVSDLGSKSLGTSRTALKIATDANVAENDLVADQIPKQALKQLDPEIDRIPFDDLPLSPQDLKLLEEATIELIPDYQAATVNIQVGGGQGSGVVISPEGHILTAAHVVGEVGNSVVIVFTDGRRHRATVVGLDVRADAAIVRLDGKGPYKFIPMATNEFAKPGRWVVAIGHPNGYETSRLPVIRLGRTLSITPRTIQTDCSLVGGDSGGPLFDLNGRVVGIHSRIGVSNSINYHVPVQVYLKDWEELNEGDTHDEDSDNNSKPAPPRKAYLGIRGRDATGNGCIITEVSPNGPAEDAGVKPGDIITKCDGKNVKNFRDLVAALKSNQPEDEIKITVRRKNAMKELTVKLGATEL